LVLLEPPRLGSAEEAAVGAPKPTVWGVARSRPAAAAAARLLALVRATGSAREVVAAAKSLCMACLPLR
jgi:hypothetical protein